MGLTGGTKLGELLVEVGAIARSQLADALNRQEQVGGSLGAALIELGFVDDATVAGALARQYSVPSMTVAQLERIPTEVLGLVPPEMAARLRALPARLDAGRLWLAMVDPTDDRAIKTVEALIKKPVRPLVVSDLAMEMALETHFRLRRRVRAQPAHAPSVSSPSVESYQPEVENEILDSMTGYIDEDADSKIRGMPSAGRMTYTDLLARLADSRTEEDVLELLLRFLAADVSGRAILLLARDRFTVWRAQDLDLDVEISSTESPLLSRLLMAGDPYLGTLLAADLGRLGRALDGGPNTRIVILPLIRARKPVGVMVGVGSSLDPAQHTAGIKKLCAKIDMALQYVQLRRQLLAP